MTSAVEAGTVLIRFVHVDAKDGLPGKRFAEEVRTRITKTRGLREAHEAYAVTVWLRTLTVRPNGENGAAGVAYSVVVDAADKHMTDTLGYVGQDELDAAAERVVSELSDITAKLLAAGAIAANEN